tara:strand:- start:417 stop:656 length:240 start_codon:yes stop_codon:yes gene_type:complete
MEMLNINSLIGGAALAFLGWIALTVVELKTETAVIAVKVEENHKILSVLWGDFMEKKNDNLAWVTRKPNIQTTAKTQVR